MHVITPSLSIFYVPAQAPSEGIREPEVKKYVLGHAYLDITQPCGRFTFLFV